MTTPEAGSELFPNLVVLQMTSTVSHDVEISNNEHALFRNHKDNFLEEKDLFSPQDMLNPHLNEYEGESIFPDLIEPLLPPHINYDKVNKYAPFTNDTSDFFKTFYFHPSFNNIMLLVGLVTFTMWVLLMNLLTIIGLWRTHRRGHMADLYLANLAVGDALLGILVLPLMSIVILLGYFPFTRFVCDLWVFVDYYLIVAASFGCCALMCNYLWMMKWPASFPITAKHHTLVILFCWVAVNLSWTPSFFNDRLYTSYPEGHCGFSISRNQYFSFYIGISGFYVPLAVSLICLVWSLTGLKKKSGIPLLSWRQSFSIGRRKRAGRLVNEFILDDVEDQKSRFSKTGGGTGKKLPKYYGPGAENAAQGGLGVATRPQLKTLKHQQSFTSGNDSKMIAQMAKDHYPLVVSSLALFIVCRSLFYVYFGVGSFVPNFLPLDLSNGVYWLMHSNAAISPLIHFAFDPELREEVGTMIGIRRNPQRTPVVQPEVVLPSIVSPSTTKPKVGTIKNSINNMSKESTFSNWSHFSANNENDNDETRPSVIEVPQPPQCFTTNEKLGEMTSVDVNKNPQILDVHKLSLENANGVVLK